jgi:hypothetical protein
LQLGNGSFVLNAKPVGRHGGFTDKLKRTIADPWKTP